MIRKVLQFGLKRNYKGFGYLTKVIMPNSRVPINSKHNVRLLLNPYEWIDSNILVSGYYDEEILNVILENIRDNDIFWDIGANIGLHSLTLKQLKNRVECHAFEPYHKSFNLLVDHIVMNHLDIKAHNFGLHKKLCNEYICVENNNIGAATIYKKSNNFLTNVSTLFVSCDVLTGELGFSTPNVVKLDVEGSELAIFEGMTNTLKKKDLRIIVFECFRNLDRISDILLANGFKIEEVNKKENYIAKR